jgi:hypothetical protein
MVATPEIDDDVQATDVLFDLMRSLGQYPSEDELTQQAVSIFNSSRRDMTVLSAEQMKLYTIFMSKSGVSEFEGGDALRARVIASVAVHGASHVFTVFDCRSKRYSD